MADRPATGEVLNDLPKNPALEQARNSVRSTIASTDPATIADS